MSRILDFDDGFTTETAPSYTSISATKLKNFANDAAFVSDKGSAASAGDVYYNTTYTTVRQYNGSAWINVINGSTNDVTATTVPYIDANKQLVSSAVTPTELGYISGLTSSAQTQINTANSNISTNATNLTNHLNDTADAHAASAIGNTPSGNVSSTTVQAAIDELQSDIDTRALTAGKLSQFAATTSSELAGVISDETGSGALVFGTSPTLTTPSTDIITLDGQASTPSNPSSGNYKVYVKDSTQKLTVLDSAGVETTVGSGSGSNNYITANDGTTIGDWVTYADAAASSPVDGTGGGSPTVTFAVSTSSAMRGTTNFLFTHGASNQQGEGFSYTMSIDPADRGKVLALSFDYLVASGTFADNDLVVYFYDVTNSALIQPAPYQIKNSSLIEKFFCEVQVPSSCASLRAIFHVATTTATAYTMRFDDFNFGPQAKLYGSTDSGWISYTPTGSWVSNTTYTGMYKRSGDSIDLDISIALTGAPTSASLTVNLPSGLSIDTSKLTSTSALRNLGFVTTRSAGAADYKGVAAYNSATSLSLYVYNASATYTTDGQITQAVPNTYANGDFVRIRCFSLPILGWSSSQVASYNADTRAVVFKTTKSTSQSVNNTTATKIEFNTTGVDTHGAWSSSNYWYVIPTPGYYSITGSYTVSGTTATFEHRYDLYIDDSPVEYQVDSKSGTVSINNGSPFKFIRQLNAGQTVHVRYRHSSSDAGARTVLGNDTASGLSVFMVEKIQGPSQIMASETVAFEAYSTSGAAIGTSFGDVVFGTEISDSHGSYNASTGVFTAPMSGRYLFTWSVSTANVLLSTSENTQSALYYSTAATEVAYSNRIVGNGVSTPYRTVGSTIVRMLAGESVKVRAVSSVATTEATQAYSNKFCGVRVGNY